MAELLPCPFCGSKAKTVLADTYPHPGMLHSWYVVCTSSECSCELGFYGMDENGTCGTYETEAEAIAAWNTRAQTVFGMTLDEVRQMMKRDAERERTCKREKHGTKMDGSPKLRCSLCGYGIGDKRWNYCPKCGAKVVE